MKIDKSMLVKATSCAGIFQLLRFTLALWTVVGLHLSPISGDLDRYMLCKDGKRKSYGSFVSGEKCTIYVTGAIWALVVGLLGLLSLAVFITSLFLNIKRIILIVYYFLGAGLVLLVACLGTGLNEIVDAYYNCKKYALRSEFCSIGDFASMYGVYFGVSCIHALLYAISGMVQLSLPCECTGKPCENSCGDTKDQPGSSQSEEPMNSASQDVA